MIAIHVAKDVEIVNHNTLFLDLKEATKYEAGNVVYCDVILLVSIIFS